MTNTWSLHGPAAIVARRAAKVHEVLDAVMLMRDAQIYENDLKAGQTDKQGRQGFTSELWDKISKIRAETGIALGIDRDMITATAGGRDVFRYTIIHGRNRTEDMGYWVDKIRESLETSRYHFVDLVGTTDFKPKPESVQDARRCGLELACAIDRHDAFVRHALPNLRKTSSHVVMVDRLAIGLVTDDMIDAPFEKRVTEFAGRMLSRRYLKTGEAPNGTRIIGNVIIATDDQQKVFEGVVELSGSITESLKIHCKGKDIGRIVEGHPCSGTGATVEMVKETKDSLLLITSSLEHKNMISVQIRGG